MTTYERENIHLNKDGTPDKRFRKGKDHPNYGRSQTPLSQISSMCNWILGHVIYPGLGDTVIRWMRFRHFYVSATTRALAKELNNNIMKLRRSVEKDAETTKELIKQDERN